MEAESVFATGGKGSSAWYFSRPLPSAPVEGGMEWEGKRGGQISPVPLDATWRS